MNGIVVKETIRSEDNPFDRQTRISWWSQDKLEKARVMVVGAGAIGNETLKNLALLGIGNIFIADFDTIEVSNLSRTVLFSKSDLGKKKAQVAAERTRELCLSDSVHLDWFHGDVVWELGTGVYRMMNVVLGCLDNVETRFAVNRHCWLAETPWIDAGMSELASSVTVYSPPESPCYQCNATREQVLAKRRRYSCDDFKRSMIVEGKAPTVQIASAFISSLQVQEAIKIICRQNPMIGKKLYFNGFNNDFDILKLSRNPKCDAHCAYPEVVSINLSTTVTLREFLEFISNESFSGAGATLDFRGDRPPFVRSVLCRLCHTELELLRPSFRIYDTDTICQDCKNSLSLKDMHSEVPTRKSVLDHFSLSETENRILDLSLNEIGIPFLHVVAVCDAVGNYKYYELAGDRGVLFKETKQDRVEFP